MSDHIARGQVNKLLINALRQALSSEPARGHFTGSVKGLKNVLSSINYNPEMTSDEDSDEDDESPSRSATPSPCKRKSRGTERSTPRSAKKSLVQVESSDSEVGEDGGTISEVDEDGGTISEGGSTSDSRGSSVVSGGTNGGPSIVIDTTDEEPSGTDTEPEPSSGEEEAEISMEQVRPGNVLEYLRNNPNVCHLTVLRMCYQNLTWRKYMTLEKRLGTLIERKGGPKRRKGQHANYCWRVFNDKSTTKKDKLMSNIVYHYIEKDETVGSHFINERYYTPEEMADTHIDVRAGAKFIVIYARKEIAETDSLYDAIMLLYYTMWSFSRAFPFPLRSLFYDFDRLG